MCVCVCVCIIIVFHRQTVSFYHNSSLLLDTRDASSWDRNPANFTFWNFIVCVLIFHRLYLR